MIMQNAGQTSEPLEMSPLLELILQGINRNPRMSAYDIPPKSNVIKLPGVKRPTPTHREEATHQILDNLKRSSELVQKKIEEWHLFEDLYYNRRKLNQFSMTSKRPYNSPSNRGTQYCTLLWTRYPIGDVIKW